MKRNGSLLGLLEPCGKTAKVRMSLRETVLIYACAFLFMAWIGMGWCAWRWYQVADGALKLLSIIATP